jgi:Putative MetA-pathway of phenol degradation
MKKYILILLGLLFGLDASFAHEPLYGLGPETLPKHLNAFEFGTKFRSGELEYELGYGFGITQNWTVRLDVPAIDNDNGFGLGDIKLRTKYALWRSLSPGVLKRLTAIAAVKLPTSNETLGNLNITAFTLGIANGYESRRWYYFSDIGYTFFQSREDFNPGGKLKYNLVGGIRPVKTEYLKPDLVLLIEMNGELSGKNQLMGNDIQQSGGNTLAVAPGFLFSYRNIMLKGGMQFGIANTKYETKPTTNATVSLEYHF